MNTHHEYYIQNGSYSNFLETQTLESFQRYLQVIEKYLPKQSSFLDIGCGTGIVVNELISIGYKAAGVEISESSISIAKKKQGEFFLYDGNRLPFDDSSFQGVGSFNVLEHVDDVEVFLNECVRILAPTGYLVICTPNFLSLTNSYHYRTAGIKRKLINAYILMKKLIMNRISQSVVFEKFPPVIREDFHPDDDAVNLTNPIDLAFWGKLHNLKLIHYVGTTVPGYGMKEQLSNHFLFKYVMGSILMVFQKNER